MKRIVLLTFGLAACFLVTPAQAWTFRLPKDQPVITIVVPNAWQTSARPDGYAAVSPDYAAHMIFDMVPVDQLKEQLGEKMDWLVKDQKVGFDKATQKKSDFEDGGLSWKAIRWDGENALKEPATVMVAFTDIGNGQVLMVLYWIPKSAESANQKDITDILASVQKLDRANTRTLP